MQLEKACWPCGVGGSHVARSLPYEGYPASTFCVMDRCVLRVFVLCRVVCTVSDRAILILQFLSMLQLQMQSPQFAIMKEKLNSRAVSFFA